MAGCHPIDGSLPDWEDVEEEAEWDALFLGNGLSVNVWRDFAYTSLFEQAKRGSRHGRLDAEDLALFEQFQTENFETVLGSVNTAIRTSVALGIDATQLIQRYQSVQEALGAAVRAVHITRSEAPDLALETIKDVLVEQKVTFTTSYDLLLYWAMGYPENFGNLVDLFWSGGRCEFDLNYTDVWEGCSPVYFLHGALHLVVDGSGVTRKIRRTALETILDQFGHPIDGDPQARPLLISEGSSHDKLRAIEDNVYLSYALKQLEECDLPLVVFGSALDDQDMHLIAAINEYPDRPVAVSLRPARKRVLRGKQGLIRARLAAQELHFFNAESHPLGDPVLSKSPTIWRPSLRP